MAEPIVTPVAPLAERREPEALEFPGCRPVRVARDAIADGEHRFEYWNLARLAGLIAAARGAPIEAVGHTDLLVRNARGERQRIVQADQILFLHPARGGHGRAAGGGAGGGQHHRRTPRQARLSESWGFPEVWAEVPDEPAPSRPAALGPGSGGVSAGPLT